MRKHLSRESTTDFLCSAAGSERPRVLDVSTERNRELRFLRCEPEGAGRSVVYRGCAWRRSVGPRRQCHGVRDPAARKRSVAWLSGGWYRFRQGEAEHASASGFALDPDASAVGFDDSLGNA